MNETFWWLFGLCLSLGWPTRVAASVLIAWFLRGLWKAAMHPRLKLVSYSTVRGAYGGYLVTVVRQELLPPWRSLDEVWLVEPKDYSHSEAFRATRESDGAVCTDGRGTPALLAQRLHSLVMVAKAREAETEELSK